MSKRRGSAKENELIRAFYAAGWAPMRAPSSGSATERELSDVLVAKDGEVIAIELKYDGGTTVYVEPEKVEGLRWVAEHYGGRPRLVARWKGDTTFYAYDPESVDRTPSGNYALRKSERDDADEVLPPDEP